MEINEAIIIFIVGLVFGVLLTVMVYYGYKLYKHRGKRITYDDLVSKEAQRVMKEFTDNVYIITSLRK